MISDFFDGSSRDKAEGECAWDLCGFGYMDFYMGTSMIGSRADLSPAYELIFRGLQVLGADWRYAFPRLHLIDLGPRAPDPDAPYDPSAAFQQDAERRARAEELAKMRKDMDREATAAKRRARIGPPPAIVRSYQKIYGRFPHGWPPDPYQPG
jgi:hypothetical protein